MTDQGNSEQASFKNIIRTKYLSDAEKHIQFAKQRLGHPSDEEEHLLRASRSINSAISLDPAAHEAPFEYDLSKLSEIEQTELRDLQSMSKNGYMDGPGDPNWDRYQELSRKVKPKGRV